MDGALRSDSEVYVGGQLTVEFYIEGDATGPYQMYLAGDGDNEEVRIISCSLFVFITIIDELFLCQVVACLATCKSLSQKSLFICSRHLLCLIHDTHVLVVFDYWIACPASTAVCVAVQVLLPLDGTHVQSVHVCCGAFCCCAKRVQVGRFEPDIN